LSRSENWRKDREKTAVLNKLPEPCALRRSPPTQRDTEGASRKPSTVHGVHPRPQEKKTPNTTGPSNKHRKEGPKYRLNLGVAGIQGRCPKFSNRGITVICKKEGEGGEMQDPIKIN